MFLTVGGMGGLIAIPGRRRVLAMDEVLKDFALVPKTLLLRGLATAESFIVVVMYDEGTVITLQEKKREREKKVKKFRPMKNSPLKKNER